MRAQLGRFGFSRERANLKVGVMSGGEKTRLLLALALWHLFALRRAAPGSGGTKRADGCEKTNSCFYAVDAKNQQVYSLYKEGDGIKEIRLPAGPSPLASACLSCASSCGSLPY